MDAGQLLKRLNKHINSKFQETFASLSDDGKTIYFVSDRKGGFGGTDIYKSVINTKTNDWGEAINLGIQINTPLNEETRLYAMMVKNFTSARKVIIIWGDLTFSMHNWMGITNGLTQKI